MELQNLNNMFTIFGNFLVFDEDVMPRVNKIYANCNISINQEPNNPANKSGRVMKIVNLEKHITILLRPNRIDIQFPGQKKDAFVSMIQQVQSIFSEISDILENPLGNRIAYVGSYFTFDDDGLKMRNLINQIKFIPTSSLTTELSLRLNTPEVIQNEDVNVVTTINNVLIGNNANPQLPKKKSLMITYDINSVHFNTEERFDFKLVSVYFDEMINLAFDRILTFQNY